MSSLVLDTGSSLVSDRGSPSCPENTTNPSPVPQEEDEFAESEIPSGSRGASGSGRTRLSRASKSESLLRMNRRVSMKPQRKGLNTKMPNSSSEEDIKKFYLNNKLLSSTSRQNALETIFEEPSVVRNELRLIGLKKLKRSMTCKDGVTISKTTVQTRRKKIKALFGTSAKKFNKLSMDAFLQHLQDMRSEDGTEDEEPYRSLPVSVTESPSSSL